ncbi:MAG: type II secretion system F family protein [Candidatus Portnoybacteria bacterium]|nr:type II secretion system F family protein [Candidatus Portnoybacteria bacterium]MDD5752379.1 type II secretion system F family protein [Candidatus Portnoybacteria bacterium]
MIYINFDLTRQMQFDYQAKTQNGEIQTGTVEAGSKESAINILHDRNLTVIFLEETIKKSIFSRQIKLFQKVKVKELTLFYRQLAVLFEAQVSPVDSLRILAEQVKNPIFKEALFDVGNDIRGGESLSSAMEKHPKIFTPFYFNVVRAGEATGALQDVLQYLADHAERDYNLTGKIKSAFTYPIVIFSLFIIVGAAMLIFVIPQMISVLQEMGAKLPFTTKILIAFSDFLRNFFWLIAIIIVGLVVAFKKIHATPKGRLFFDFLKLKMPIFNELFKKIYLARFAENLKTLLKGGISILEAMNITANVVGNKVYENIILEAKERVRIGETISGAFKNHPKEIPALVTQMVGVGEKTAQIDNILDKVASFYQQDVDRMVGNMTQLIEPIMILFLGGGVGFLVAAILMPMYSATSGM